MTYSNLHQNDIKSSHSNIMLQGMRNTSTRTLSWTNLPSRKEAERAPGGKKNKQTQPFHKGMASRQCPSTKLREATPEGVGKLKKQARLGRNMKDKAHQQSLSPMQKDGQGASQEKRSTRQSAQLSSAKQPELETNGPPRKAPVAVGNGGPLPPLRCGLPQPSPHAETRGLRQFPNVP